LSTATEAKPARQDGHVAKECEPRCSGCNLCELFVCKLCEAGEGTLPSHCPGEPISSDDQTLIYHNTLDFHLGAWINRSPGAREVIDPFYDDLIPKAIKRLNAARRG
jgi:hypothetical protein